MGLKYQIVSLVLLGVCISYVKNMVAAQTGSGFIVTPSVGPIDDDAVTVGLVTDDTVDVDFDSGIGFSDIGGLLVAFAAAFTILTIPIIPTPSGVPVPMIQALMMTPDATQPAVIPGTPPASTVIQVPGQQGSIIIIPSPPAPPCNECPPDYMRISGSEKCYKYVNDRVNCGEAFNDCDDDFDDRGNRAMLWKPETQAEAMIIFNSGITGDRDFIWTGAKERGGPNVAATYPDNSPLAGFATSWAGLNSNGAYSTYRKYHFRQATHQPVY